MSLMAGFGISLEKPYKLTGEKYALVFELNNNDSELWEFESAVDSQGKQIKGKMYASTGFDQKWSNPGMDCIMYAYTITPNKKDTAIDNNNSLAENSNKNLDDSKENNNKLVITIIIIVISVIVIVISFLIVRKLRRKDVTP